MRRSDFRSCSCARRMPAASERCVAAVLASVLPLPPFPFPSLPFPSLPPLRCGPFPPRRGAFPRRAAQRSATSDERRREECTHLRDTAGPLALPVRSHRRHASAMPQWGSELAAQRSAGRSGRNVRAWPALRMSSRTAVTRPRVEVQPVTDLTGFPLRSHSPQTHPIHATLRASDTHRPCCTACSDPPDVKPHPPSI